MPKRLNPEATSSARRPRSIVKLNGQPMPGWIAWEIENNSHYSADTFRVRFAIGALADVDLIWLSEQSDLMVEVFAGFPHDPEQYGASDLTSLIVGRVDHVRVNAAHGTVEMTGRDFAAVLIDTKRTETFLNQSAAAIVETIAARHGMKANVPVKPAGFVGGYYEIAYARINNAATEWDMLTMLAQEFGYQVFVTGTTVNFVPPVDPMTANYYALMFDKTPSGQTASGDPKYRWSVGAVDVSFERNVTLSRDVTVKVMSWNTAKAMAFDAVATATHGSKTSPRNSQIPFGTAQAFEFSIPCLDQVQVDRRAESILQSILVHERLLTARMPGDLILSTQTPILVSGTDTRFDQYYIPESIVRSMSIEEGFEMRVRAKYESADTRVTVT